MSLTRGPLFALHTIFVTVVVIALVMQLHEREREVERVRAQARQEREETERMNQEIQQQQALLEGLGSKDPYVIELLVRDRLRYASPGEISPPPLPVIDKQRRLVTK